MLEDMLKSWKDSDSCDTALRTARLEFADPALVLDFEENAVFAIERPALRDLCVKHNVDAVDILSARAPKGYLWVLIFAAGQVAIARMQTELLS